MGYEEERYRCRNEWSNGLWLLGSMLLVVPSAILFFSSIGFALGVPVNAGYFFMGFGVAALYGWWMSGRLFSADVRNCRAALLVNGMMWVMGGMVCLSLLFFDVSYDGQVYHQEGIAFLGEGWNPVRDVMTSDRSDSDTLLNHYARGPWVYGAALYRLTGMMESGKAWNGIFLVAVGLFTAGALLRTGKLKMIQVLVLAFLTACNPVSIYQIFSSYLDGQLASLLAVLAVSGWMICRDPREKNWTPFLAAVILLVNLKFTGVVYSVFAGFALVVWLWRLRRPWQDTLKVTMIAGVLAVLLQGANPYVSNTVGFGHPFYPLYGAGAKNMDIMTYNSPKSFLKMNSLEKLFYATFARSDNREGQVDPVLKMPFTIEGKELLPFVSGADVRLGGFGPLYSGAMVLSVFVLAIMCWQGKNRREMVGWIGTLMASILINPECWWARYAPQLWLLPLSAGLWVWLDRPKGFSWSSWLVQGILLANMLLVAQLYITGCWYSTRYLEQEFEKMRVAGIKLDINFEEFTSNRVRFTERGVPFQSVTNYVDQATGQEYISKADITYRYLRYNYLIAGRDPALAFWGITYKNGTE